MNQSTKYPLLFREKRDCCGCAACADLCPASAIAMKPDIEGFLYPHVDRDKCVGCGRCAAVCPMKNHPAAAMPEICSAAKAREGRAGSSSGGMFPLLARHVLDRGGVAYGAAWTSGMHVAHRAAETAEELRGLCKTKYVQSDCRGAYRSALNALNGGRPVLFCGTPCQAEAMRRAASLPGSLKDSPPPPWPFDRGVGLLRRSLAGAVGAPCQAA